MSHYIQGARIKAAALVHARKQIANLGFRFRAGAGSVRFSGDTAYASWRNSSTDHQDWLDGFNINYPDLPDNAMISRQEADFISAYTLHELGHIAFTKELVTRGKSLLVHHCWNGIEDARIERAMIASGKARNARSMFKKLMSKFTSKIVAGDSFNPCKINSAPFALALVCRAAMGDGNGFAKQLLSRIPEPHRSIYAEVTNSLESLPLDRSGSQAALVLAERFVESWKAQFPETFQTEKYKPQDGYAAPPQDAEQQSDDSDDSAEMSEDDDSDSYGEPDDSDGYGESDDFGDSDESDAYDDLGNPKKLTAAEEAAQRELEQAAADMRANAEEVVAPDDNVLDSVDGSGSDDDESCGSDANPFVAPEDDALDEKQIIAPEPEIDDLFKAVQQRTKSAINLRHVDAAYRSEMRRWSRPNDVTDKTKRSKLKKLNRSSLPALKAQLYRILCAPERCGWDGGAMGGRFDGKRTSRMLAGSEQVFKRRWLSEGVDTAVSVVIDMSGSMGGHRMSTAVDLAWAVASACEASRTECEVVGFANASSRYNQSNGSGYDLRGNYVNAEEGGQTCLVVAKRFADRCESVAHLFDYMKRLPAGGTPDYEGVKTVCEQLSSAPQKRKVVVVITDGFGDVDDMYKLTDAAYRLYGVDVIGFGVGTYAKDFARAYAVGCPVSAESLHKTSLKTVIKQLEARDTRRVM